MNLRLLQLGDSALPIGGYSHSWGLEAAVAQGLVRDAAMLETWVRAWLRFAVAPLEGVVVAATCRAATENDWQTVRHANTYLWVGLAPPTLRLASRDMGQQLLALAEPWPWAAESVAALRQMSAEMPSASGEWHHAAVFATLVAASGGRPREALQVYLHQAALGAIGAGVRAIPIGHTHGQQVLVHLQDDVNELTDALKGRELETAGSFCPAYEVLCHAQSHLYTRLFRS
jgi:urease accessory protein